MTKPPRILPGQSLVSTAYPRFHLSIHRISIGSFVRIHVLQFVKVSVEQVRLDGVCHHSTHERRVAALQADVAVIFHATNNK